MSKKNIHTNLIGKTVSIINSPTGFANQALELAAKDGVVAEVVSVYPYPDYSALQLDLCWLGSDHQLTGTITSGVHMHFVKVLR